MWETDRTGELMQGTKGRKSEDNRRVVWHQEEPGMTASREATRTPVGGTGKVICVPISKLLCNCP